MCTCRLSALQEFRELRAGENGLRLAKCLNLLVPRSLADVEILHDEVAGPFQEETRFVNSTSKRNAEVQKMKNMKK